jgi:hypothetical protein
MKSHACPVWLFLLGFGKSCNDVDHQVMRSGFDVTSYSRLLPDKVIQMLSTERAMPSGSRVLSAHKVIDVSSFAAGSWSKTVYNCLARNWQGGDNAPYISVFTILM